MKKIFFTIIVILIVVIVAIALQISSNNIKNSEVLKFNKEFENYKDKKIYGADVTSIINKAIDNNEENSIEKDEERKLYRRW